MRALHEVERIESRVLGAVRVVDASTGAPLDRSIEMLVVEGGARVLRNRSGLYVIHDWVALAAHAAAFSQPPDAPPLGSQLLELRLADHAGEYLPRSVSIALPRDPDPAQAGEANSLFQPIEVALYPSPVAAVGGNWSVLRASVVDDSGAALGGALLRVRRGDAVLARGLSDWRGEALLPVVGVPVTTFSDDEDAVVVDEIDVVLDAFFDVTAGLRTPAADVATGREPAQLPTVDPEALDAAADGLPGTSVVLAIAARRSVHRTLTIPLP